MNKTDTLIERVVIENHLRAVVKANKDQLPKLLEEVDDDVIELFEIVEQTNDEFSGGVSLTATLARLK